jgi:putative thioredoxin
MVAAAKDVVDREGFRQEVVEASRAAPVVVDFWAPWCQPCLVLGPTLERLAQEDGGRWTLVKVDVQAHPELAEPFGLTGIPAVFAFRDGEVVDRFAGALPAPQVRAWLDRLVPAPEAEATARAEAAASRGDGGAAVAGFEEALRLRPGFARAAIGLAELVPERAEALLSELPAELPGDLGARRARIRAAAASAGVDLAALRARVSAEPADLEARWVLAQAELARGDLDAACGELLDIVRRDRRFRDDGARKAMLTVFDLAGQDSPVTRTWRNRLSMELFK